MKNTDIQENTTKLLNFISDKFYKGELNNESLVQIIAHCGDYLNLMSIPQYAKENKMTYNGVKNYRKVVKIFNQKFVIDNL